MIGPALIVVLILVAYVLGFRDGINSRPEPPLRGNYPHTEDKDE